MEFICPKIFKDDLAKQCKQLGLTTGDTVMVHTSLRAVGEILGGPDVLIAAILESIGQEGTMMVYLGCQTPFDDVGRGIFTAEEEALIIEHCPPSIQTARERAAILVPLLNSSEQQRE